MGVERQGGVLGRDPWLKVVVVERCLWIVVVGMLMCAGIGNDAVKETTDVMIGGNW